jgi:site-specific recombinase XerD
MPYLEAYFCEAKPVPQPVMTRKSRRMCYRISYRLPSVYSWGPKDRRNNLSWHPFRHALTTELSEAGLDHTLIQMCMGWSGSAADMPRHYLHPENLDAKVIAKHPFLKMWECCIITQI